MKKIKIRKSRLPAEARERLHSGGVHRNQKYDYTRKGVKSKLRQEKNLLSSILPYLLKI